MDARQFHEEAALFVDALCELKALGPLRVLLPHWPMSMGLTDEWVELARALKTVRVQHAGQIPEELMDRLASLQHAAESAVNGQ